MSSLIDKKEETSKELNVDISVYINNLLAILDTYHDFWKKLSKNIDIKKNIIIMKEQMINGTELILSKLLDNDKEILEVIKLKENFNLLQEIKSKKALSIVNKKTFKTSIIKFIIRLHDKLKRPKYLISNINKIIIDNGNFIYIALTNKTNIVNLTVFNDMFIQNRNLIYIIILLSVNHNTDKRDHLILNSYINIYISIFNIIDYKFDYDIFISSIKRLYKDNVTYPSSYIYDQGYGLVYYKHKYNISIINKNRLDASSSKVYTVDDTNFNNIINDITYTDKKTPIRSFGLPIIKSSIKIYSKVTNNTSDNNLIEHCWYAEENGIIYYKNYNYANNKEEIGNTSNLERPSITIISKYITNNFDNTDINWLIQYFGYKRFGDWIQNEFAKHYQLLISSGDFYCQMYALLNEIPIILSDGRDYNDMCDTYIYNYNIRPTYDDIKKISLNREFIYSDNKEIVSEEFIYNNTIIDFNSLKQILTKYLKYKYKYLKLSNKNILNVSNNINELIKKNYETIYYKYIKYKNKYIKYKKLKDI
jgi:hypothetical protein